MGGLGKGQTDFCSEVLVLAVSGETGLDVSPLLSDNRDQPPISSYPMSISAPEGCGVGSVR